MLIKSKKMPGGGEYVSAGFEVGLIDLRESWMWDMTEFSENIGLVLMVNYLREAEE